MPDYHVTARRRADAAPDMPIRSFTLELTASCEEMAEMMADSAVVALVGVGQLDLDEIYEET
jgi:hypothetical protein